MKKISIILAMVFFFSFWATSNAQPTINLELAPSLELAQVVYVSDFDLLQQGALQYLFQITVDNTGNASSEGILRFEIYRGSDEIASTQTLPFNLINDEVFTATNIELSIGFTTPVGRETIRFDEGQTTNPSQEFEDEVLQGGKLPRGNYNFIVRYTFNNGADETESDPLTLFINNPTYLCTGY
jgi:hypothetical protein